MYTNIDNPPGTAQELAMPRLDADSQRSSIACIAQLLVLITQGRERLAHSLDRYEHYSAASSPFVSREAWQDDVRKWSYICYRLERYYLKKVCELNSMAYRAVVG